MDGTFEVSRGGDWSVSYNKGTRRYSLYGPAGMSLSTWDYVECEARASGKGVALAAVAFELGKTPEGKLISAKPIDGGLELDYGVQAKFEDIGSCVAAGMAKTIPVPRKAFVAGK
jgi:hypothetical protein